MAPRPWVGLDAPCGFCTIQDILLELKWKEEWTGKKEMNERRMEETKERK